MEEGGKLVVEVGWLMVSEMIVMDIDISFVLVLDVGYISVVIGECFYYEDLQKVLMMVCYFIDGMYVVGMKIIGKYFLGYGVVIVDLYKEMLFDLWVVLVICDYDMVVFKSFIVEQCLDVIMLVYVIYLEFDLCLVSGLVYWLKMVLCGELGFDGVIFFDDLLMEGVVIMGSYVECGQVLFDVGCDMIFVCNNCKGVVSVLDNLLLIKVECVMKLYYKGFFFCQELRDLVCWKMVSVQLEQFYVYW